jgi:hypothetical protein
MSRFYAFSGANRTISGCVYDGWLRINDKFVLGMLTSLFNISPPQWHCLEKPLPCETI